MEKMGDDNSLELKGLSSNNIIMQRANVFASKILWKV